MLRLITFLEEAAGVELVLPVTPSSYQWAHEAAIETVTVDQLGDLNFFGGKRMGSTTLHDCLLPAQAYPFLSPGAGTNPWLYLEQLERWVDKGTVVRWMVSGTPVNAAVLLEGVTYREQDGTNDLYADITLRQYTRPETPVLPAEPSASGAGTAASRDSATGTSTAKTCTVASGDTLWGDQPQILRGRLPGLAAGRGQRHRQRQPDPPRPGAHYPAAGPAAGGRRQAGIGADCGGHRGEAGGDGRRDGALCALGAGEHGEEPGGSGAGQNRAGRWSMAEYQVVIVSPQGETWDVTERVGTLTWSGSIKRVSRSVEAVMATPNDGSLPELPCELGNELRLWAGARTRFRGNIVTREKATEGVTTTLTALDRGRFLANNEGWYTFRGAAPEEAVRALCGDFGIPVAALAATGTVVSRKYPGVALDKIVDGLYTLAAQQNGRRYLSRFNGLGELEVVEKPEAAALELAPGKNLQSLRVTEDISKLRNTVEIYSQTGARVRTVSDAESAALYGQFQHILTQRDGEDAGAEAQAYLEDNGLQQTMTVECLGDPELISGSAVLLRANTTGVTGLCWIDSDTHTWKNGQYFCRLSLNFRSLTNEVEAGQEV